jgi:hypothetical protein
MIETIRIKLITPTPNKLAFVKLIKECSGLGLRESKDLCDELHKNPHIVQHMPIQNSNGSINYRTHFTNEIKYVGGEFLVNGGIQWDRNVKMLKLGIADEVDYVDFIKDYILNGFAGSENILNLALSKLSKNDIQEVFNTINLENI